jgi:chitinase
MICIPNRSRSLWSRIIDKMDESSSIPCFLVPPRRGFAAAVSAGKMRMNCLEEISPDAKTYGLKEGSGTLLSSNKLLRYPAVLMATVLLALFGHAYPAAGQGIYGARAGSSGMLTAVYVYDGHKTVYRDDDAVKIDQMFYSFALFRRGRVSASHWENFKNFQAYIQKHPSIMPILSVGGWGADGFSQAAATAEGREAFVNDVLALMQEKGFLGVDIDWEYPGSSAAGIKSSPKDKQNYTLLLQGLRSGMDALTAADLIPRRLCIAISGEPYLIPNLEVGKIGAIVDQVNLMTYNLNQPDIASHHSALYASYPSALSADACVRAYVNAGIPAGKIMLGAAFYGYRWTTKYADPLYQPATKMVRLTYSDIAGIIRKTPDAVKYDNEAQAPYFSDGKVFISYDDGRSIAQKGAYAKGQGLMGLFAWEYGEDTTGELVDAMRSK